MTVIQLIKYQLKLFTGDFWQSPKENKIYASTFIRRKEDSETTSSECNEYLCQKNVVPVYKENKTELCSENL